MKALTTAGLTKLIQLIKSSFISNTDTVTTNTVTLATVATSGSYNDLSNKPTIPTVDQTYDGTSTNAQSGVAIEGELANYQSKLVSGTNIKTINNTSILGSGDIDTKEIFIATDGTTTYAEIMAAYNAGKTVLLSTDNSIGVPQGSAFIFNSCYEKSVLKTICDSSTGWGGASYYLADTDLSNLSATGKTVIDGQWISDGSIIVEDLQLHTNNDISYTISQIPNDGHKYEAIISCLGTSTATSGQPTALFISSSEMPYAQCVYRGTPRSAANVSAGGSIIIPLGTDRGITIQRTETYYGTVKIYLRGYRRIGSNT